jgi:hypothetical protein
MDEILSATVDSRNGIVLDPRTKLFMLITITTLMFSTSNDGIMNIVKPILSLIPFALILSEHKFKTAGKYAVLYAGGCRGSKRSVGYRNFGLCDHT